MFRLVAGVIMGFILSLAMCTAFPNMSDADSSVVCFICGMVGMLMILGITNE